MSSLGRSARGNLAAGRQCQASGTSVSWPRCWRSCSPARLRGPERGISRCRTSNFPPLLPACTDSRAASSRPAGATASSAASRRPRWRWARIFRSCLLRGGSHPITLGFGSQVYARFSLTDSKTRPHQQRLGRRAQRDRRLRRLGLTLEAYHESSHLGDEYEDRFAAKRLDWTREVLSAWASYSSGPWRFMGSASYALLDELGLQRPGWSCGSGLHQRRPRAPYRGARSGRSAGIYFAADAATELAGEHLAHGRDRAASGEPGGRGRLGGHRPRRPVHPAAVLYRERAATWGSRSGSTSRRLPAACVKPVATSRFMG